MKIKISKAKISAVATLLAITSINVFATCSTNLNNVDEKELRYYNADISNTENSDLKSAYDASQCEITQRSHDGGDPCPGTKTKLHVTVADNQNNKTCHVFFNVKKQNGKICTTCR